MTFTEFLKALWDDTGRHGEKWYMRIWLVFALGFIVACVFCYARLTRKKVTLATDLKDKENDIRKG